MLVRGLLGKLALPSLFGSSPWHPQHILFSEGRRAEPLLALKFRDAILCLHCTGYERNRSCLKTLNRYGSEICRRDRGIQYSWHSDAGDGDKMRVHLHALVDVTGFAVGVCMVFIPASVCGYIKTARDVVAKDTLVVEVSGT